MMKYFFISLFLNFFLIPGAFAQSSGTGSSAQNDFLSSLRSANYGYGSLILHFDQGIEENYYKHILYNTNNPYVYGWRLRIFSGKGNDAPEAARQIRAKFLEKFEDVGAYLSYDAPDYKVYVGNCRTRSEMLQLTERIIKDFPNSFPVYMPIIIATE
jgi:hypothetical protein